MSFIEEKLEDAFVKLEISQKNINSLRHYLNLLKIKDIPTYEHSGRVALLGIEVAEYLHIEKKALFFPGLLHDIGKIEIDSELLKKKAFDKKDMEIMKYHPIYSYHILKDIHLFSAEVALRHHKFQKENYPIGLLEKKTQLPTRLNLFFDSYARILSLIDFYDAAKTRENDKFKTKRKLTKTEVKQRLLEEKKDFKNIIERLYSEGIFE